MRPALAALACFALSAPAFAITGQAPPAQGYAARAIVMVVDPRGDLCTGTALARDLVLTAAHCVTPDMRIKVFQTGQTIAVRGVARASALRSGELRGKPRHRRRRAHQACRTAFRPRAAGETRSARRVAVGETLTVAGFGVTAAGTDRGLGVPRMATLAVTGRPGALQIRLFDVATRNVRAGLGACTGDSGAPAFEPASEAVIGVVSWTTAARDEEGCGGLTGVTPLLLYRDWIVDTARKFNSPL